jgi:phage-related protein
VITLDGHTLDYFGLIPLKGHDNPTPATRDKSLVIPGKHGAWDFGADMDVIQFNFPMAFNEIDRTATQKRIREFVSFLLDSKGKPRTFTLAFDYEPEKYYYVRYSGQIKPERLFGLGTFDLPLTAFDPTAYAEQTYKRDNVVTTLQYDAGFYYEPQNKFYEPFEPEYFYENPTQFTWNYSKHYCGIFNYSHYETPLILEIEGSVINPRITNQTTGKTLFLPTITNQKMVIDASNFTVKVNDLNKLTGVIGMEDFNLTSDDNSLLFEGGLPNATVTFKWKHKFL